MLQTRNGKRTGPAAVRIAVEMVNEGLISKKEAVLRVDPQQLDQLLHPVLDPEDARRTLTLLAKGLPASPGAAVGTIAFTAEDAVEASKKAPVILVRKETVPDDIHGMEVAKGILTARGGMTSHAAVVCRGMGTPLRRRRRIRHRRTSTRSWSPSPSTARLITLKEGDWLSLDGSTGEVFAGKANTMEADPTSGVLQELHGAGPTSSAASSACAPMPISRATPRSPASSAPKASASAAPSTCSSPKTASSTCRP